MKHYRYAWAPNRGDKGNRYPSEDRPIINRPIIPPPWVLDRGAIREGGAPPYFGEGGL